MPDAHAGPQQYDLEELENAAAFAVAELDDALEAFQHAAGIAAAAHSPEVAWSDPVQAAEVVARGALYVAIKYADGVTAFLFPQEDAAFLAALLAGVPAEEVRYSVKAGLAAPQAELLAGLLAQAFAARGGLVQEAKTCADAEEVMNCVEADFGVSFLLVKAAVSPQGYSDCRIMRLYSTQFAARFSGEPGTGGLDTQVMPAIPAAEEAAVAEQPAEIFAAAPLEEVARPREILMKIPVRLKVVMARKTLSVRELVDMLPGTVIEFERGVNEPVELVLNGHTIARGQPVRAGRRYGARISAVASVGQRIGSLK